MAITQIETQRHLFELITAALGAKSALTADFENMEDALAVAFEAEELIDAHVNRIIDDRWTDEYLNALTAGASLISGILLRTGDAKDWPTRALMARFLGLT